MSGPVLIALAFWLLLTGDLSPDNLVIGLVGALAAGRLPVHRVPVFRMLATALRVLAALPVSYAQAFWLVVRPHRAERIEHRPSDGAADPWRTFERVFLITLTPKSLAFGEDAAGGVDVHHIEPRRKP
jgi:multicomponent Na+:H+ antiporter subunit E